MIKTALLLILSSSPCFCQASASDLHGDKGTHLTEANATFSASPSQYSGKAPEFVISADCRGGNVAAFQNTSAADVSAITFRDYSNVERAAIGVGNPDSGFWSNLGYIEMSNKTGSPDDFAIVNTTASASKRVVNVSGAEGTATFTPLAGPNLAAQFVTDGPLRGTISFQDLDEAGAPGILILDKDGREKVTVGYANAGFNDPSLAGKGYVQFPGDLVFRNTGEGRDYPLIVNGRGIVIPSEPPASAASSGQPGQISWDANYVYVCTARDTWKRSTLSGWNSPIYTEFDRATAAHHRLTLLFLFLATGGCLVSSIVSTLCLSKEHWSKLRGIQR